MLLLRFAFYQNNILAETQHEFAYFHRGSKKTFRKIVEHQVICLYLWIIGSQTVQFVLANSLLFILNKTVSKIFYMGSRVFTAPTETTCWFNFWAFKTNDEDVFERGCVASEEGEVDLHQNSQVVAAWWLVERLVRVSRFCKLSPIHSMHFWWFRTHPGCAAQWILQVAVACSNSAELT